MDFCLHILKRRKFFLVKKLTIIKVLRTINFEYFRDFLFYSINVIFT